MATQAERTDATTSRLLDEARALFGSVGYAQTSTEDVVAAASVTRGALYHHFGNKEGLFAAVFERELEHLATAVVAAAAGLDDPRARIRAGCRAFLESCLSPEHQRIALVDGPAVLGFDRVRELETTHTFGLLAASLRDASGGKSSRAEIEVRATLLFGALCEAGLYIARATRPRAALKTVAAELDGLLEALLAPSQERAAVGA